VFQLGCPASCGLCQPPEGIEGCTIEDAINFDPDATIDDGSCVVIDCGDPTAVNFRWDVPPENLLADNSLCVYNDACPSLAMTLLSGDVVENVVPPSTVLVDPETVAITSEGVVTTANECCILCQQNPQCNAYAFCADLNNCGATTVR